MNLSKLVWILLREIGVILFGLSCTLLLVIFLILSLPIYVYRFFVVLCAKHFSSNTLGNPVTPLGNYFAGEFLPNSIKSPPRATLVVSVVVDRPVPFESVEESIKSTWFGKDSKFPELHQYVESWMGFLFWKNDHSFLLENHLKPKIIEGKTDEEMEENVCLFIEELVNKLYEPKRSPWECYVVQNYKNKELQCDSDLTGMMTLLVFRFHHGLVDGHSILNAIIEKMMGIPLKTISLPTVSLSNKRTIARSTFGKILSNVTLPFQGFYEVSQFFSLAFTATTPWHVPLNEKKTREFICKAKPIPLESLRHIKNRLGVSLTSVLMSCASAAISQSLNLHHLKAGIKSLPTSIPLPRPNHPDKLRNHVTTTVFQLPTNHDLEPLERLAKIQNVLTASRNMLPRLVPFVIHIMGSHLSIITQQITKNRHVSTAFSNFPGPGILLDWEKGKVLTADFAGGALPGVAGVGFAIFSFGNYLRIAVAANSSVMERHEVKELISFFLEEITKLDELSIKHVNALGGNESTNKADGAV